jgi:hypothetical protein
VEQVLSWGVSTCGKGEDMEKGCRRVNVEKILCTHVCKWKIIPVETTPEWGEEG